MSPSWRERFTAVVGPDRVALVRWRRGWGTATPQLQAQVECGDATPQAALAALRQALSAPDVGPGVLTLVLSSHFVSCLLVPWRSEIARPAELAAFATICFDQTFGPAEDRAVVTTRERPPGSRLAAALDAAFLEGLRAAAGASRLRLASIQPYLATAFNRLRGGLPSRDFLLLVAEPSRASLLLARGGGWASLSHAAVPAQPRALADLIEREAQLADLDDKCMPPIFVHAPGRDALQVPACLGVLPRCVAVPTRHAPLADPLLSMALAVA